MIIAKRLSEQMNSELRNYYEGCLPAFRDMAQRYQKLNWPHLITVPDIYPSLQIRLMVVGQQTAGWGEGEYLDLDKVLDWYTTFKLGDGYRSTPFWRAAHELSASISAPQVGSTFIWSNVFKFAQAKERPEPEARETCLKLKLLEKELVITKPNIVVFFTGPYYDKYLQQMFSGLSITPLSPRKPITKLSHPMLPHLSFRTYHPNFLLRKNERWVAVRDLLSAEAAVLCT